MSALEVFDFVVGASYGHLRFGVVKVLRVWPVASYLEVETLTGDVVFVLAERVGKKEVRA